MVLDAHAQVSGRDRRDVPGLPSGTSLELAGSRAQVRAGPRLTVIARRGAPFAYMAVIHPTDTVRGNLLAMRPGAVSSLFGDYTLTGFDEMFAAPGRVRPHYAALHERL